MMFSENLGVKSLFVLYIYFLLDSEEGFYDNRSVMKRISYIGHTVVGIAKRRGLAAFSGLLDHDEETMFALMYCKDEKDSWRAESVALALRKYRTFITTNEIFLGSIFPGAANCDGSWLPIVGMKPDEFNTFADAIFKSIDMMSNEKIAELPEGARE
jgi:hypothetical protein